MKIKIGDYEIGSDGMCITLFRTVPSKNNPDERRSVIVGHYSNTLQACDRLLEEKISESIASTVEDLKTTIIETKNVIAKALRAA
jgi:hypothetical protein